MINLFKGVLSITACRYAMRSFACFTRTPDVICFNVKKTCILGIFLVPRKDLYSGIPYDCPAHDNLMKLAKLPRKALQDVIIKEWNSKNADEWKDTYDQRKVLYSKLSNDDLSKYSNAETVQFILQSIMSWSLCMLVDIAKALNTNVSLKNFQEILLIFKKIDDYDYGTISRVEYFDYWRQLAVRLLQINVDNLEIIDECKPSEIESIKQLIKYQELEDLRNKDLIDLADQSFKEGRFQSCI